MIRAAAHGTPSFSVNGDLYQGDFDTPAHGIGRTIARQPRPRVDTGRRA